MKHGTVATYRKELRDQKNGVGDGPCGDCRAAQAIAISLQRLKKVRDRRTEGERRVVRNRALVRLSERYPEDYQELLADEQASAGR
jgi:hypothetical protein